MESTSHLNMIFSTREDSMLNIFVWAERSVKIEFRSSELAEVMELNCLMGLLVIGNIFYLMALIH